MKSGLIYTLVIALLLASGAGMVNARGSTRQTAGDDAPATEAQDQSTTPTTIEQAAMMPVITEMRPSESRGHDPYARIADLASRTGLAPSHQIHELHFHVPLRI